MNKRYNDNKFVKVASLQGIVNLQNPTLNPNNVGFRIYPGIGKFVNRQIRIQHLKKSLITS